MKKTNILTIIMSLVFLIIFNVIFFVAGVTEHNSTVWISYTFIHIAYLAMIITPLLIRKGKSQAVFGYSIYGVSATHFFLELIAGVIFILFAPENYKVALIVQICMLGLYLVIFLANLIANEKTAEAEENRQPQLDFIKNATSELSAILAIAVKNENKKNIEKACDDIKASPAKSHISVVDIEKQILVLITNLKNLVNEKDNEQIQKTSDELTSLINERNRKLKLVQ